MGRVRGDLDEEIDYLRSNQVRDEDFKRGLEMEGELGTPTYR